MVKGHSLRLMENILLGNSRIVNLGTLLDTIKTETSKESG